MARKSGRKSKAPNQHLKRQRAKRGWSQVHIAQHIGTSAFTVGRWERGTSIPSPYFRAKLRDLFQLHDENLGFPIEIASLRPLPSEVEGNIPLTPPFQDIMDRSLPGVYDPTIPPLPTPVRELVGRDNLLHQLKTQLLTHQNVALSALNGLPGVGKTALANQIAHDSDIHAHFSHGILWACMGQHPNIRSILSNWAALLTVAPSEISTLTTIEEWANTLRDVIGERRMLIVLDDVWKIEDALALRVGSPHCTYLLTTRFPRLAVQFAAEHPTVVHELNEEDSLTLLARFVPTVIANDPDTARILVRAAGGLPLALTIMGRYLQLHAHSDQPRRVKAALKHLHDIKERLYLMYTTSAAARPPSLPTGTSFSLQAVIALSDHHLSQEAQRALRTLALFAPKPNTFSEDAALAVSNVSTDVLDALENAGLLEACGADRYSLHQTITDYAHLDSVDTLAEQRLVLYSVNFVETYQKDYARLEISATNILTALHIASTREMHGLFISGVLALAPFWEARGLYDLAETHLKHALHFVETASLRPLNAMTTHENATHRSLQARLYLALGHTTKRRGVLAAAEQYYALGTTLAQQG